MHLDSAQPQRHTLMCAIHRAKLHYTTTTSGSTISDSVYWTEFNLRTKYTNIPKSDSLFRHWKRVCWVLDMRWQADHSKASQ